jgi:trehalose 6-phosphate synthase/phosphatase
VFRLLPARWRHCILDGLLGADLIGFHTHEYTNHFLQSVLRILGHGHSMGQIPLAGRVVKADTFPMGIDYQRFVSACSEVETEAKKAELSQALDNLRIILSVDRLDYSKGILHRLDGYETLLEVYPDLRGKVVLTMVVVPSRIGVVEYDKMKQQLEERVGRINGRFGTIGWVPIIYQYQALSLPTLVALYSIAEVALVTPLRDGMNLIAKEYIACRREGTGVLVLSEMAGAARELGESVIINPNDRRGMADALHQALIMPAHEQRRRNRIMQERLQRYDVVWWVREFLAGLDATKAVQDRLNASPLDSAALESVLEAYRRAEHRLVFLDYDGTLTPLVRHPDLAAPSSTTRAVLRHLALDQRNQVVIISGRSMQTLAEWFDDLPLGLVAEHGLWRREKGRDWQASGPVSSDWKAQLRPILDQYAERLPGAMVEDKGHSLVWHYRMADPGQAQPLAAELLDRLSALLPNANAQVLQGSKIIEVRPAGVNKGAAARDWLSRRPAADFVLAVGDDTTDEDLFAAMPDDAHSIRVGSAPTCARYVAQEVEDVLGLLRRLGSDTEMAVLA